MPTLSYYPHLLTLQSLARAKKIKLFLVGGYLRDLAFGIEGQDFDFAVSSQAIAFARHFARLIKGAFVLLDENNGCARVVKKSAQGIATFDFADFRAKSLSEDLKHRDFTINALYVALDQLKEDQEILSAVRDPLKGLSDLKARRIRMVGLKTFNEDPLRLLRAYSLKAKFQLNLERQTLAQIKKDHELLRKVARERILEEFFKILNTPQAAQILNELDRQGLLVQIIPQISLMVNVEQGGYHHLDVWPHSLETVKQLENVFMEYAKDEKINAYLNESLAGTRTRRSLLKLAALLHDIGKPQTRKFLKGRMTFHGHEHAGKSIARPIARLLKLSTRERMILENLILWHLRPGYLSNFKKPSERAYFRYFRDTQDEALSLALLAIADQRSTRGPMTSSQSIQHLEHICRGLIDRYFQMKARVPLKRLLTGDDLITKLKLKPSQHFGKILLQVQEAQAAGQISSTDEAFALAKKYVARYLER